MVKNLCERIFNLTSNSTPQFQNRVYAPAFIVASAPALFQQTMEKVLQGLPGVVVYIDNILVMGKTDEEYLENFAQVFSRLLDYGLCLKKSKCSLMRPSVEQWCI